MKTAVVTIVTKNYIHFGRTLLSSVKAHHPEWDQYLLLVDEIGDEFNPGLEPFKVVTVAQLNLPDYKQFLFRYNAFELTMAMKPYVLDWLFKQGELYDKVIYFDADIYMYGAANELINALDEGNLMVLTPHLTSFLEDGLLPGETQILLSGTYNLGCIGLSRHKDAQNFMDWWKRKLEKDCIIDFSMGLFADQKWLDLAPGYFEDVKILRHEGYNVAYWNLAQRLIKKQGDKYLVNGNTLTFFHFSGFDVSKPNEMSKYQNRFKLDELNRPLRELFEGYSQAVKKAGYEECKKWSYAFGCFADGTPITDKMRAAYRNNKSLQKKCGADPFLHSGLFRAFEGESVKEKLTHFAQKAKPYVQHIVPDDMQKKIKDFLK